MMAPFRRSIMAGAILIIALLLAGCGNSVEVVYRCEGTASNVTVRYTDKGETVEDTATLPWEKTVELTGNDLSINLEVINADDTGDINCNLLVNGGQQSQASGETSVAIEGQYSRNGNSVNSFYRSMGEFRPTPTPAPTPTPVPTPTPIPVETVDLQLFNLSPVNVCGLYITPSDSEDWGLNQFGPDGGMLTPDGDYTVNGIPVGKYDVKVETCGNEIIGWNIGADFEALKDQIKGPLPLEVTGQNYVVIQNLSSLDICLVTMRPSGTTTWLRNLLSEKQVIPSGNEMNIFMPPGQIDLGAATCSGEETTLLDVTLVTTYTWTIED